VKIIVRLAPDTIACDYRLNNHAEEGDSEPMSRLYEEQHRALQDRFQSRPMADRIEQIALKTEIGPEDQAFIESRDFFFLTTVDHQSRPTVSYKGGAPGFVRVVDPTTFIFPSYDGNGMYLSMGNITANPHVGFLFIDFERPFRLRAQGLAEVSDAPEHLACFKEAELVVSVKVTELWMNCPRYIHRYQKQKTSRYVPQADIETPLCEWKRTEPVQDVLRPHELAQVAKAGTIPIEEWIGRVVTGDENA
jgi:predicted pyridoxine 5'-phosphate oxidase superfamily flavin-nucleotide-binding protein